MDDSGEYPFRARKLKVSRLARNVARATCPTRRVALAKRAR